MAERIETAVIAVPAGTAIATPQTTTLSLRDAILEHIEVVIPPGPSGLTGFAFVHSGQQVIPFTEGDWIVGDNEKLQWDIQRFPTGDKWSVRAYNLDVYVHSIYLRLFLKELSDASFAAPPAVQVIASGPAVVSG